MNIRFVTNRSSRRRTLAPLAPLLLLSLLAPTAVFAQDDEGAPLALSQVPSSGAARSGPIRLAASETGRETDTADRNEAAPEGVPPVAIQIDKISVDAEIERVEIVDGVMQNPSGPWVVSWYQDLYGLNEGNNVVMAGHVDYWTTGPAVFYSLGELTEGDVIEVYGEDEEVYEYEVNWSRTYNVADELTPEVIQEDVVGDTDKESLTLITCGGEFNYETGEYLSRMVLRATRV